MKKPDNREETVVTVRTPEVISDPIKYKVIRDEGIILTKPLAFEFLELDTFPGERQVNERHVQALFNQWAAGRFIWEHVIISTAKWAKNVYRINGQHTCWMRVNVPRDIKPEVRLIEYEVPDEEHLRALYCVFDRAKSRTPQHIIKASLVGTTTAAELWPSTLGTMAAGFKMWQWQKDDERLVEASDIVTLVEGPFNNLFRVVGVAWQELYDQWSPIRRAAVIGAMFATFEVSAKASLEFWHGVGTGLNLPDKSDARYQLRRWLDTHTQSFKAQKPVSNEETYRVCINAWNRWRKGDKVLTGLRATDKRVKPV